MQHRLLVPPESVSVKKEQTVNCSFLPAQNGTCLDHSAKLIYLNFHPHEVVSRYSDPQLQVGENDSHLLI